jgi:RNA polymerase sigma factor (sigma-70 family)
MGRRDLERSAAFAGLPQEQCDRELQRYFSRRLNDRQDVRELTQEVWLRLCRVTDRDRLREPMAYVYRIAANVLAEFRLRRRREPVIFDTETTDQAAAYPAGILRDQMAERAQAQHDLLMALAKMSPTYRRIVWMRLCEHKSFQEIGQRSGFSEGTARRYYFHAIKMLWKSELA